MAIRYRPQPQDQPLLNDIAARIAQNLTAWYGSDSAFISRTPEIFSFANSFLLRFPVHVSNQNKAILVKIRRNPKMNSLTQAVQAHHIHVNIPDEYNTMRVVYERIADGHTEFAAIRPLAYFEDRYAIVMEEFPSRSLRHLIEKHRSHEAGSKEFRDVAQKAGRWLRFFHESVHSTIDMPYTVDDVLAEVRAYADRLDHSSHGRIDSREIVHAFAGKLASTAMHSIPFSEAHQDMTCDNVLYSESGKVCVIDIKTRPEPIYSDLALLLIHPETFRKQIYSARRYLPKPLMDEYRRSIIAGYFGDGSIDEFLINIYCSIRILDKWTMYEELFSRYKGMKYLMTRPLAPYVGAYFRRLLQRYLDQVVSPVPV